VGLSFGVATAHTLAQKGSFGMDVDPDLIRLERAEIGYRQPLLPPLDLHVRAGVRLAVLGPNGSGKSTLLKTLLGLTPLLSGRRHFPRGRPPRIGYVPQAHRADPVYPLTAFQVTLQGRYGLVGVGRFMRAADRAYAREQLARVGLQSFADAPFRSLSGGQRQRVLLARALAGEPELVVLDEFTSELDPAASSRLLDEVSALTANSEVGVLFVTHEIAAAATHAQEVALVDSRRNIFEAGSAKELLTGERLTALYGQTVRLERREDRTVVYLESGRA
jgi:ABC-type Mn2+/Zn2+ transport system ATPase subunit